jgi:hypothetical protein
MGPFAGKCQRDGLADATAGSRDDGHFVLETFCVHSSQETFNIQNAL